MTDLKFEPAWPIKDLRNYHKNARRSNVAEIEKSLTIHGQYRALVANVGTHTGRPNEVLGGNHTLQAARNLGWDSVAVTFVDVDDDQAKRIVLVDNSISDKATFDVALLTAELTSLEDLDGTGYTEEDLDKLLNGPEEGEDPKDSEHEEDYNSRWELVVECSDEEHQRDLYQRFQEEGLTVRVLSL